MSWASLRVPASSANLGPGFDALGLALDLYLECRFRRATRLAIRVDGCDAAFIPVDSANLIWQTALRVAEIGNRQLPFIELEIHNEIPLGKGLGSSAAALTAGVVLADSLLELNWTRERILDEAARMEGHPDNVAACVLGGITVSAIDDDRRACAIRFDLPEQCALALLVPDSILPTADSRAALPPSYSREDAVFNVQRTGLLVGAFAARRMDLLSTALCDRMHQPFRCSLVPGLREALTLRAPGLFGCVLSGAGPSILVFHERGQEQVVSLVEKTLCGCGQTVRRIAVEVASQGFQIGLGTIPGRDTSL